MKILKLSFENINSLKGKWQIDFTDPAFYGNAIFAITGVTGSGKTTILDAICLALYGETPRIDNISATQNELMSIGTAHSSSEVVFEIDGQIYRAFWSQKRAKQQADGKLQAVSKELAKLKHPDDNEGKILEEKANQVKKAIEELLGMNKEQFTRSVMLAQGNFAAFLQSDAKDRGEILEQITGTQIYADISKAAFEKNKAQNQQLKLLTARLNEIQCLTDEEFHQLNQELIDTSRQEKTLAQTLQNAQEKQHLWQTYQTLGQEIEDFHRQLTENQLAIDAFAFNQQKLDAAKSAQKILPIYQEYQRHQQEYDEQNQSLNQLNNALEPTKQTHEHQRLAFKTAKEQLHACQQAYEAKKPIIAQVRSLDGQLTLVEQNKTNISGILHEQIREKTKTEQELSQSQQEQARIASQLDDIKKQSLDDTDIKHLLNNINQYEADFVQLKNHIEQLDKNILQANRLGGELLDNLTQRARLIDEHKQLSTAKKYDHNKRIQLVEMLNGLLSLDDTIQNPTTSDYQNALNLLQKTANTEHDIEENIKDVLRIYEQYHDLDDEQNTIDVKLSQLSIEQQTLKNDKENLHKIIGDAQHEYELLTKIAEQQKQIVHLQSLFNELQDGKPCPLCGSDHHPFKDSPPHTTQTNIQQAQTTLSTKEQELTQLQEQWILLEKKEIRLSIDAQNHQDQQTHLKNKQQALHAQMSQIWQIHVAGNLPPKDDVMVKLDEILRKNEQRTKIIDDAQKSIHALMQTDANIRLHESKIYSIEDEGKRLQTLRGQMMEQLASTQQGISTHLDKLALYLHKLGVNLPEQFGITPLLPSLVHNTNQYCHHIQEKLINLPSGNTNNDWIQLAQNLQHYQLIFDETLTLDCLNQLENIKQKLTSIHDNQQILARTKADANQQLAKLNTQCTQQQDRLTALLPKITENQAALSAIDNQYQQLTWERHSLFGDDDSEQVENQLQSAITLAQQSLDKHQEQHQKSLDILNKLLSDIEHGTQLRETLANKINASKTGFEERLALSDFADETCFLAACLDDESFEQLSSQAQILEKTHQQIRVGLQNSQHKQAQLLAQNPALASQDNHALGNEIIALQAEQSRLNQRIGELSNQQTYEQHQREEKVRLTEKIIEQGTHNAIWEKLDALIGSADGKKYRNFVQGLTLDLVLYHANEALKKMSDRYVLMHDGDNPKALEVLVMDIHQGGAVRSSKNLSGGESFIISLALALGLSQINSRKIHIDSLFLDEGFGTLDEDTLDIALNTLFELQQDGKSIGIISHVASLKERIDTQIVLEKQAGGSSIMSGAGVRRLN